MIEELIGNKAFLWGAGFIVTFSASFVVWVFKSESGLDKRVAVLEEINEHQATKEDVAVINTKVTYIEEAVKEIKQLLIGKKQ